MSATPAPDEVIERLKLVTRAHSERELSSMLGYGPSAMTNKRQRNRVPYEECARVALERDVSLDWLVLGRGEAPEDFGAAQAFAVAEEPAGFDEFVSVALYDIQAAAGAGALFNEERIKHHVHFRRDWIAREGLHPKDLVAIDVVGDSMDGTLHERDTVLVNRAATSHDGVFLLLMGDGLRIKRLQWLADGSLRLSSDNELYDPETIARENLSQIEIIGHCHWRGGRIY